MIELASARLLQHKTFQQFMKFCIIGASSAVIDVGIFSVLKDRLDPNAARCISFSVAVVNGYVWNSTWTFRGMGAGARHAQFVKFVAINLVGLLLNLIIMNGVFLAVTGHLIHKGDPDKIHTYVALGVAIVTVSCWNFLANRKWTFSGERVAEAQ